MNQELGSELSIFVEAAEQLEGLKAALTEQMNSSEHLRILAETLGKVSDQIALVPAGLTSVLSRAEFTERRLDAAASKVESLRDAIPGLVTRIERSDVGRSIDALTADIAGSQEYLREFKDVSVQLKECVQKLVASNDGAARLITEELERGKLEHAKSLAAVTALRSELLPRLNSLEANVEKIGSSVASSANASVAAFAQTTSSIRSTGELQGRVLKQVVEYVKKLGDEDITLLRKGFDSVNAQLVIQSKLLEELSKKKGFTF